MEDEVYRLKSMFRKFIQSVCSVLPPPPTPPNDSTQNSGKSTGGAKNNTKVNAKGRGCKKIFCPKSNGLTSHIKTEKFYKTNDNNCWLHG